MSMPPGPHGQFGPQPGQHPPGPPPGQHPQGPPPGYPGGPAQFGPGPFGPGPFGPGEPPAPPMARVTAAIWVLAAVSVLGVVLGLSLKEDGHNAWHSVHAWGGLAVVGAVLTAATAFDSGVGLGPRRAWQVAVAGAGLLVLYWILLVLPDVGSNTSLLTTIGAAAGVLAVWIAPVEAAGPGHPGGVPQYGPARGPFGPSGPPPGPQGPQSPQGPPPGRGPGPAW